MVIDEKAVFLAALALPDAKEREAYLQDACSGQPEALGNLRELLSAHEESQGPLDRPPAGLGVTVDAAHTETTGTVIGPYKLLQQIGEGGMGTVFMAEQTHPVQRKVALKVIKPGMDSRQVIARFEAERQALAMMDHVNIARVFDAGATEAGRPYFVMELVHGVPITKYCDDNHLTPRERLELFVPVCQAIQHAHQKGIIHRDIKPSNVMVTLYDGKPVPKVIDFGVAKATEQKLTERTLFTQYGTMVGTLEYMSPEQAEMNALGVDTRSDIYSLGVLLYELLTGSTPLTHKRMKEAAYAEILRMIKEEEPPRPSTRLSDSGEALASISANRHTEPAKLTKLVRGELDWIVMKTLEKDRNRRYETANGLGHDVENYLHDEPVMACPPSAWYRLKKLVRRNRKMLATGLLAVTALVVAVVGLTVSNHLIRQKQAETEAALDEAANGRRRAREALDQMSSRIIDDWLGRQPKLTAKQKQFLEFALARYEEFTREAGDRPEQREALARAYCRVGDIRSQLGLHAEAGATYARSIELFGLLVRDHPGVPDYDAGLAATHINFAILRMQLGEHGEAMKFYEAARSLLERLARDHPSEYTGDLIRAHNNIGILQMKLGRPAEALTSYGAARALAEQLVRDHPEVPEYVRDLASTHNNIAATHGEHCQLQEALKSFVAARALREQLVRGHTDVPEYSQDLARTHQNIAVIQADLGQLEEALKSNEAALALFEPLVRDHPGVPEYAQDLARTLSNLGIVQTQLVRLGEALKSNEAARALQEALVRNHPDMPEYAADLARTHCRRALAQKRLGQPAEALKSNQAACGLQESLVRNHPRVPQYAVHLGGMYCNIGNLLSDRGDFDAALASYGMAIAVLQPVSQGKEALTEARENLRNSHSGRAQTLGSLHRHVEALTDWDRTIALDDSQNPLHRLDRALTLTELGAHARATAEVEEVAARKGLPAVVVYDAACVYSRCSSVGGEDDKVSPAKRHELAEKYAARAVALLRLAVQAGYKDFTHMKKDTYLDPLRQREDFNKLIAELAGKTKE